MVIENKINNNEMVVRFIKVAMLFVEIYRLKLDCSGIFLLIGCYNNTNLYKKLILECKSSINHYVKYI